MKFNKAKNKIIKKYLFIYKPIFISKRLRKIIVIIMIIIKLIYYL